MTLKLPSLEFRRFRGDLIEVYKILHNLYDPATTSSLLTLSDVDCTRGHNLKLNKPHIKSRQFQKFFTNRVISAWNALPADTVNCKSLNTFKNHIDKLFKGQMYSTNWEQN
jgi:hypothetical protein